MKRFVPIILALSLFLSSCGALGAAAPVADVTATISVEEIRATADAMVYSMLTETAAAMPTNTLVPPTETPLPPTVAPTATLEPTLVEDSAAVTEAVPTVAAIATNTMVSSSSSSPYACTEKPLTSWDVPSITITVSNNVKGSTANVFLCIVTDNGQAGYISIPAGSSAQVPYGFVTATAWVTGDTSFNDTIFFDVKTSEPRQLVIENGRVYYRGGCYPNC